MSDFESPHDHPTESIDIKSLLAQYGFDMVGGGRNIIPGDKKVGTIISIKQLHNDFEDPEFIRKNNPLRYQHLIRYQKAIYGELASRKVKHIFLEGIRPADIGKNLAEWKKNMESDVKDIQKRDILFANYGGAFVYFLENSSVELHATESQDIVDKLMIAKKNPIGAREFKNLQTMRDYHAVGQVKSFLLLAPGTEVALIFGAYHDFSDKISFLFGADKPQEEKISFLKIAQEYITAP